MTRDTAGTCNSLKILAGPTGFEPATSCVTVLNATMTASDASAPKWPAALTLRAFASLSRCQQRTREDGTYLGWPSRVTSQSTSQIFGEIQLRNGHTNAAQFMTPQDHPYCNRSRQISVRSTSLQWHYRLSSSSRWAGRHVCLSCSAHSPRSVGAACPKEKSQGY